MSLVTHLPFTGVSTREGRPRHLPTPLLPATSPTVTGLAQQHRAAGTGTWGREDREEDEQGEGGGRGWEEDE